MTKISILFASIVLWHFIYLHPYPWKLKDFHDFNGFSYYCLSTTEIKITSHPMYWMNLRVYQGRSQKRSFKINNLFVRKLKVMANSKATIKCAVLVPCRIFMATLIKLNHWFLLHQTMESLHQYTAQFSKLLDEKWYRLRDHDVNYISYGMFIRSLEGN